MKYLIVAGVLATGAVAFPPVVQAQEVTESAKLYNFKVEAGSLSRVIGELASQSGASVSVDGAAGMDAQASGVVGVYTLKAALDAATTGTSWTVEVGANRAFRIVRRGDDVVEIGTIVVRARREDFVRTSSSLLTRTDTPMRQTPGTVDSVTAEVFKTQNAIEVSEALRNIPGLVFNTTNAGAQAIVRGDTTGGVTYTNGLQNSTLAGNPPITDIEAIEVLKGPASILTGASIAGGVINFVPKRATGRPFAEFGLGVGSGNETIVSVDLSDAILPEQGLFGRLVLLSQRADELPGGGNNPRQSVFNPIVGFRGDGVRLDASLQVYEKDTPSKLSAAYDPATSTFLEYGDKVSPDSGDSVFSTRLSYNLEYDLAWTDSYSIVFRNKGLYQDAKYKGQFDFPFTYDYFGMGAMLLKIAYDNSDRNLSQYADLFATFSTGKVSHQAIVAVDYLHSDTERALSRGLYVGTLPLVPMEAGADRLGKVRQYGLVVQDQMTLDRFHALVALRKTWYESTPYVRPQGSSQWDPASGIAKADKFLASGGLVYDITPEVSTYVSYTTAFSPPANDLLTQDGSALPPTTRKQYEIGVKSGFLDDALTLNVAAYTFETDREPMPDPTNPYFFVGGPGLKGDGIDVSLSGSITETLKILAGYTYSDVERGDGGVVVAQPDTVGNLWAIKTFKFGGDQSLDVGLGGNYNSGFMAQDFMDGQFHEIDRSYISLNGSLGYTNGRYSVNAVFNNILDRKNYLPSSNTGQLLIDVPRSFRIDFRAHF